jgi:hypothetical protein
MCYQWIGNNRFKFRSVFWPFRHFRGDSIILYLEAKVLINTYQYFSQINLWVITTRKDSIILYLEAKVLINTYQYFSQISLRVITTRKDSTINTFPLKNITFNSFLKSVENEQ